MNTTATLLFLAFGYLATVAIEAPLLVAFLPSHYSLRTRIGCGFWLTACTYPVVVLVIPNIAYGPFTWPVALLVTEIWVALTEVALLRAVSGRRLFASFRREDWVVVLANLASFLAGELFVSAWLSEIIKTLL